MATPNVSQAELKQALKEALAELLQENREVFGQALAEALDDVLQGRFVRGGEAVGAGLPPRLLPVLEGRA